MLPPILLILDSLNNVQLRRLLALNHLNINTSIEMIILNKDSGIAKSELLSRKLRVRNAPH